MHRDNLAKAPLCDRSVDVKEASSIRSSAAHQARPMLRQERLLEGNVVTSVFDLQDTTGMVFWRTFRVDGAK